MMRGLRLVSGLLLVLSGLAYGAGAPLVNVLKGNPSPYLALHGDDPVAWQVWGEVAVARAKQEGKLLYVSSGYFSCHWCHVMQRESYKDPAIARILNTYFIPVKVDRELEPALDARLIEFAERTRGNSGWPLNVFLTPEGDALYAVLYLPPAQFTSVLEQLVALWDKDPATLKDLARRERPDRGAPGEPRLDDAQVRGYVQQFRDDALALADPLNGGFGDQSKFPSVPQLEFLLDLQRDAPDAALREFLELSLENMARLGMRDHLGGGFFRYTVDPTWYTPHFEKMLYDNSQLARLYLRAARVLGNEAFRVVALDTLDFLYRDMRRPAGALLASFSAVDDQNVEGGYYLWDLDQLRAALSDDEMRIFRRRWGMVDAPPFEDGYLPVAGETVVTIAGALQRSPAEVQALLASATEKLRRARARRHLPEDTKLLAAWNGLALAAFVDGARSGAARAAQYHAAAAGIREYLGSTLWDGQALRRAIDDAGRPVGRASLEDYAYVAEGLLAWAELTGRDADRALARRVVEQGWARFYADDGWRMGERSLMAPEEPREIMDDGPMASPSAVLIAASLRTAGNDAQWLDRVRAALNRGHGLLAESPFWRASHIRAMRTALQSRAER